MAENNPNEIHIGHHIQEQLKAGKPSIDCALLLRISQAMQFNFFRYYAAEVAKGMQDRLGEE